MVLLVALLCNHSWRLFFSVIVIITFVFSIWSSLFMKTRPDPVQTQDDSMFYVPFPHSFTVIIDEPVRCQQGAPFLVLMVPVAPGDRMSREAIRKTWGGVRSVRGQEIQLFFLLGMVADGNGERLNGSVQEQIVEESRFHHDLLQSDFMDSYKNLTVKTMFMLWWLSSHCPHSAFAMKVDSDVFLNVENLVQLLLEAPRSLFYTGAVHRFSLVNRDPSSRWFLPRSVFASPLLPPYALGLGYVLSMDLPSLVLEASAKVRALYIEDVYVALCLREVGVAPQAPPHHYLFRASPPWVMPRCYWTTVITTLLESSQQLLQTWPKYQQQTQYCQTQQYYYTHTALVL